MLKSEVSSKPALQQLKASHTQDLSDILRLLASRVGSQPDDVNSQEP